MSRGSSWHIWDFHLHTPDSILNNEFGNPESEEVWDRYVAAIEDKASRLGVAAIGVTDYFTIEGYKHLRRYQEQGRLANIMLFPNIEFRIDKVIYRTRGVDQPKRLNMHVLFAPDVPASQIEEHFLHDLSFVRDSDPFTPSNKHKLKISNLKDFGEELRNQQASFRQHNPFFVGCLNAVVNVEQIKEYLERDSRFRGKYLVVLADEDLSLMDWESQDHATRKVLLQIAHAVFSSNARTRSFCLGRKHTTQGEYLAEFKTFKPCLWGCDSHGYEQRFLEPDEDRFCWVKAEPTWEGLKQVLYEPDARVYIGKDDPEVPKSIFTLDSISIDQTQINDGLRIDDLHLELSPNLVTVIGGRGSGKTALLDLIAACFKDGAQLLTNENSFYHRLYCRRDPRTAVISAPVPVTIWFKNEEYFGKRVGQEDRAFERSDVLYVTQNHIEELTAYPQKLNEHVIDLVFANYPEERRTYTEFSNTQQDLERQLQSINLELVQIEQEITGKRSQEVEARQLTEGTLADLAQRISDYESQQGETAAAAIDDMTTQLRMLRTRKQSLEALVNKLRDLGNVVTNFATQYSQDASVVNGQILELMASEQVAALPVSVTGLDQIQIQTQQLASIAGRQILPTQARIEGLDRELNALSGIGKTIAELRRRIEAANTELSGIDSRIKEIENKEKRIQELREERAHLFAQLALEFVRQRRFLQKMIAAFELGRSTMLYSVSFSAFVSMSGVDDYIRKLASKVDGRQHSEAEIREDLERVIGSFRSALNSADDIDEETIRLQLKPVIDGLEEWAAGLHRRRSATTTELLNVLYSRFFDIGLDIEFGDRPLSALSMGERAVVLLKILLSLDDRPLLIDQPEEHLDNRYIYDELVPAFRDAKNKRQIVIATHNANLVVNTDAEQIIVAENIDGVISYRAGTLEDRVIREDITEILEGGPEAFKRREEKYGYIF